MVNNPSHKAGYFTGERGIDWGDEPLKRRAQQPPRVFVCLPPKKSGKGNLWLKFYKSLRLMKCYISTWNFTRFLFCLFLFHLWNLKIDTPIMPPKMMLWNGSFIRSTPKTFGENLLNSWDHMGDFVLSKLAHDGWKKNDDQNHLGKSEEFPNMN